MKKLLIVTSLLMVTGSAMAAETWHTGNSAPVDVTFTAPDSVHFSLETHSEFSQDSTLLATTMLGAVTASKAGGDGNGIRFHWLIPDTETGKGDVTNFKNEADGSTIAVKLKDTEGNPLIPAEVDNWYQVDGKATNSTVTVQFYPESNVGHGVTAGKYKADIQAAVYSQ